MSLSLQREWLNAARDAHQTVGNVLSNKRTSSADQQSPFKTVKTPRNSQEDQNTTKTNSAAMKLAALTLLVCLLSSSFLLNAEGHQSTSRLSPLGPPGHSPCPPGPPGSPPCHPGHPPCPPGPPGRPCPIGPPGAR